MKKLIFLATLLITGTANAQIYQWAFNVGSTSSDYGRSIATGPSGEIYVTGYFQGTADFDPGLGIANLTSTGSLDIYVAKYDAAGNYLWAFNIGSGSGDVGYSIATDPAGDIYVTGYFRNTADFNPGPGIANLTSAGNYDIFVAKYDALGNYLWAFNIGAGSSDYGYSIATNPAGEVYVTGRFMGTADFDPGPPIANLTSAGGYDIFVAKYDGFGNYLWAFNIGAGLDDNGYSISIDPSGASGEVYVTGSFQGTADFDPGAGIANLTSAGNYDIYVAKYDAAGNYLWAFNIGAGSDDEGFSIATGPAGEAYVTGRFRNTADFDPGAGVANLTSAGTYDIFVAKYDEFGNYLWAFNIGAGSWDAGYSIATGGPAGEIYVTGAFQSTADFDPGAGIANLTSAGGYDIFVAKYDAAGNYLCAFNIGAGSGDYGLSITIGSAGEAYVTGRFMGTADFDPEAGIANLTSAGNVDIFVAKYDCDIIVPIELRYFTARWQDDNYNAVLTEWATATEINNDYFEVERSADAINFSPIKRVQGAGNSSQTIDYSWLDGEPYKEITSYYRLRQVDFNGDYSYSQIEVINAPDGIDIINLYPNPAVDEITFTLLSSASAEVSVTVVNVLGQQVIELLYIAINKGLTPVNVDVRSLSSGYYFVKVVTTSGLYHAQKQFVTH